MDTQVFLADNYKTYIILIKHIQNLITFAINTL